MASTTKIESDDCGSRFRMDPDRALRNPDLTCPECGADIKITGPDEADEADEEGAA